MTNGLRQPFIVLVFTLTAGQSYSQDDSPSLNSLLTAQLVAKKILGVSSSASCVSSVISDFVGLEGYYDSNGIGGVNEGTSNFFGKRLTCSRTLQNSALVFYEALRKADLKNNLVVTDPKAYPLNDRPTLDDEAGIGRYADVPPQSLYKLALSVSGNSPTQALETIAICGNDDIDDKYLLPGIVWPIEKLKRSELEKSIAQNKRTLVFNGNNKEVESSIISDEKSLAKIQNSPESGKTETAQIHCPGRDSKLFIPGTVAPNLSSSFRTKIANIQAPTKGARVLPAKSYHAISGAYLGCKL